MVDDDLHRALEQALYNGELLFHYQPKISLLTGRVTGVEALIRWVRADGRMILPAEFVPVAEASGFIRKISCSMLDKLIADLVVLQEASPGLGLSFNLTAQDFASKAIVEGIQGVIKRYRLDPRHLQVELTETALIEGSERVRGHIQTLVDLGVSLAMDDFGTGYSTIDVLSQWPFTVVKLHQGLIGRLFSCKKCSTIVRTSIHMAHQLGITVVAEGIENAAVYEFLLKAGCMEAQGYWMGRPMPLDAMLAYLRSGQCWPGSPIGLLHIAQLDHLEWRRTFTEQVIAALLAPPGQPVGFQGEVTPSQRHCQLGLLDHESAFTFKHLAAHKAAVEQAHEELHAVCQQIVTALDDGASRSAITGLLSGLTQKSGEVMKLLQEMELAVLLPRETKAGG